MSNNNIPPPPMFKSSNFITMNRASISNGTLTTSSHETDYKARGTDTGSRSSSVSGTSAKRRRRSTLTESKEEIAKKKKELKAAHSIIEKKRRIKMNREFEALKYMIPACRSSVYSLMSNSVGTYPAQDSANMHKLTILQSTVEYIKYLHQCIRLMRSEIQSVCPNSEWLTANNIDFCDYELDLEKYRNIESEFDFQTEVFNKLLENNGNPISFPHLEETNSSKENINESEDEEDDDTSTNNDSGRDPEDFNDSNSISDKDPISPLIAVENYGSSSSLRSSSSYQSPLFSPETPFNNSTNIRAKAAPCELPPLKKISSFQLPSPAMTGLSNAELEEEDASKALLLMKQKTSIHSLLN
ncbi:hypothetical protein LJB42_000849 [Komagataella kurtzmanii]|nr:hypothetical protein LJB42_000849 [Komagataella kurtzmanii]